MIVFRKSDNPAFNGREFSHIECDVDGCGNVSPEQAELSTKNLFERGWFVRNGMHRCPEHVANSTLPPGPVVRAADGSEGFVR